MSEPPRIVQQRRRTAFDIGELDVGPRYRLGDGGRSAPCATGIAI